MCHFSLRVLAFATTFNIRFVCIHMISISSKSWRCTGPRNMHHRPQHQHASQLSTSSRWRTQKQPYFAPHHPLLKESRRIVRADYSPSPLLSLPAYITLFRSTRPFDCDTRSPRRVCAPSPRCAAGALRRTCAK